MESKFSDVCVISDKFVCAKCEKHGDYFYLCKENKHKKYNIFGFVGFRCLSSQFLLILSAWYFVIVDLHLWHCDDTVSLYKPRKILRNISGTRCKDIDVLNSFINHSLFECSEESFYLQFYEKDKISFKKIKIAEFDAFINSIE